METAMRPVCRTLALACMTVAAGCGANGGQLVGDMAMVALGHANPEVLVAHALNPVLRKAGIQQPENFVKAIFTFRSDRKEAARLFLEGARDNGLDREASDHALEVIAGAATVAQLAGGGSIAIDIRDFALYMRGLDLGGLLAVAATAVTNARGTAQTHAGPQAGVGGGESSSSAATLDEFASEGSLLSGDDARMRSRKSHALNDAAWLYVEVEPADAQIRVDGATAGRGKAFVRSMTRYCGLGVSAAGFETVDGVVELAEREVTKVRLTLRRAGGHLTVLTDPPGVVVRVEGAVVGHTPVTLRHLAPGAHLLALEAGSWTWSGTADVDATDTHVISMQVGGPEGVLAAGQAEAAAPVAAPSPAPVAAPGPSPMPAPAPVPAPLFASAAAASARPDCGAICGRYVQIVAGSDSLKEPIRNHCLQRCESGDMRFSVCAWKARSMGDVSACSGLPESR